VGQSFTLFAAAQSSGSFNLITPSPGSGLGWNFDPATGVLSVVVSTATPPTITTEPQAQTVTAGAGLTLSVSAGGTGPFIYQWRQDGVAIAGATRATYTVASSQPWNAGSYTVLVTNAVDSVASSVVVVTVNYNRISNLSVRTNLAGGQTLIVGFVTDGAKPVLVRGVGPGMATIFPQFFGPGDVMDDPRLELYNNLPARVDENDNWSSSLAATMAGVGAFPLTPGSRDAALLGSINGPSTVQLKGAGSGVVLVDAYDTTGSYAPRLKNVSARNQVGTGANILIAGFVIEGNSPKTVLIRGIGPALRDIWGVTTALVEPVLEVYSDSTKIAENDNWDATLVTTFDQVGAYRFTAGSRDAALLVTLPPGLYTAQLSGVGGTTGEGVVEVYEVP
jgi:hypothetical protein